MKRFQGNGWFDVDGHGWREGLRSSQRKAPGYSSYSTQEYLSVYQHINISGWSFERVLKQICRAFGRNLVSILAAGLKKTTRRRT